MRKKKRTSPKQDYLHFLAYESTRRFYRVYQTYKDNVWGNVRRNALKHKALAITRADRILNEIL